MSSSQEVMMQMDSDNHEQVQAALKAVNAAHAACTAAERSDEVSKIADAQKKLQRQLDGLKEIASRKRKPKLTEAQLAHLEKKGDPDCPQGQQYEHHQNKKMIRCTGPQIFEMNWQAAKSHFEARGFSVIEKGSLLRLEKGAQVYDFQYEKAGSSQLASCLTIVPDPGVPWQEVVSRATSVQPRRLKLNSAVPTAKGARDLLVEGDLSHVTVKIGLCQPTPGQKAFESPADSPQ